MQRCFKHPVTDMLTQAISNLNLMNHTCMSSYYKEGVHGEKKTPQGKHPD